MNRILAVPLVLMSFLGAAEPLFAQGHGKLNRIGYLGNIPPSKSAALAPLWQAFTEGLREYGYVEGRTIVIEARFGEGETARYAAFAQELVAQRPDLIVAVGSDAVRAAKASTTVIPIVMLNVSHAVETGFVASLARPGGNVTGLVNQLGDTETKLLELIREVQPGTARIALLWSPINPGSARGAADVMSAAAERGMSIQSLPLAAAGDLDRALESIVREKPDGLIVHPVPQVTSQLTKVVAFAIENRIPAVTGQGALVRAGLLLSYAPDSAKIFRRAADYIDRILRGAKPAEMAVEQPTRFEISINLKTARSLGLEIPPSLLARADAVLE